MDWALLIIGLVIVIAVCVIYFGGRSRTIEMNKKNIESIDRATESNDRLVKAIEKLADKISHK